MPRVALKFTEEILSTITELTGAPSDVLGDETYALVTIVSLEPVEMNFKLMTEDNLVNELQIDSDIHIIAL